MRGAAWPLYCGAAWWCHLARDLSDGGGVALIEATRFSQAFQSQHAQAGALRRARPSKCSAFLRPPGLGAVRCGPHPEGGSQGGQFPKISFNILGFFLAERLSGYDFLGSRLSVN